MGPFKSIQPFYHFPGGLLHCAACAPHGGSTTVKVEPLQQKYPTKLKAKEWEALILKQETRP